MMFSIFEICLGVKTDLTAPRMRVCSGASMARKLVQRRKMSIGMSSKLVPWPEQKRQVSRLTVVMSSWRVTAQQPEPSSGGIMLSSGGRCHDTGSLSRS